MGLELDERDRRLVREFFQRERLYRAAIEGSEDADPTKDRHGLITP